MPRGVEVKGLPQPPRRGGLVGPRKARVAKQGPKQAKYGVKFRRKYAGLNQAAYSAVRARKVKPKGLRKVSRERGAHVLYAARGIRKSAWALKWLKKLAKHTLRHSGPDGRNHGYKGSKNYGRTGRSGRRR